MDYVDPIDGPQDPLQPQHDPYYHTGGTLRRRSDGTLAPYTLEDFEIGRTLGRGAFGLVYLARELKTKFLCAIKVIFKSQYLRSQNRHLIQREIEILMNLRHPNIMRLYGYFYDDARLFLIMEIATDADMFDFVMKTVERNEAKGIYDRCFDEFQACSYVAQVVDALTYCHSKNVAHRDIKLENLLLTDNKRQIKIADFGWAVHSNSSRRTICGTTEYMAPELWKHKNEINYATAPVDTWAVGCLLYEFLTGKTPFAMGDDGVEPDVNIKNYRGNLTFPRYFQQDCRDLILKMLDRNPETRIKLGEVRQHPFMTRVLGEVPKIIPPTPQLAQVEQHMSQYKISQQKPIVEDDEYLHNDQTEEEEGEEEEEEEERDNVQSTNIYQQQQEQPVQQQQQTEQRGWFSWYKS